jgi:glycosyltransferase involved in cell wall biosynthesis
MPAPYVVNGRFLQVRPTGLQRTARALLVAAREAGLDAEVVAPADVTDSLVDRRLRVPRGRGGGQLFEQLLLPAAARGRTVLSLTNTAPVLTRGVVMVHDLAPLVGPEWFVRSMRLYVTGVLIAARRARRVLTVSNAVADELVEQGVRRDRIAVVRQAVDPGFAPAPEAAVDAVRHRMQLDRPYVVMLGWQDPRKDVATAVAAHRAVVADTPHDLLLVGGRHPVFAPVATPTEPGIRVAGYLADGDLVPLLSGAAALLYPSRYEGFGLPPLEALAGGTPAVVSDLPVLRESTADGARFVPIGDVKAWSAALREALNGDLSLSPPPAWTWRDAAAQLLAALPS